VGRGAPSDELIRRILMAFSGGSGRLGTVAIAQSLGVSTPRVAALVNAARRVLNVDEAQILLLNSSTGETILDLAALRHRFNV
jgi:hypothetical protein